MPLEGRQMLPREAAALLWNAGWVNAENLMIMVCVAMAESALFTKAYNYNPPTTALPNGSYDWGYLQLNDGGVHGSDLDTFKHMAFDPVQATLHARKMYVERSFSPWVAYKNHSWEKFIPQASVGVCNMLREKYNVPTL